MNLIRSIIVFSLKNRAFVFAITAAVAVVGIYCYETTPIVAFPDFTNTQIRIITRWPGRSAKEVERFVTIPTEIAMNSVQRKTNLRSQIMFGLSVVTLVFEDDVDDMYARQQVNGLLQNVELPEGAETELTPPAGPIDEVFRYTLHSSKGHTSSELRTLQDWVIDRHLRTVSGVADVIAFGGPVKTYEISVNPNLLAKYNLSALDVYNAVSKSNINVGGDVIEKSEQAYVVRGIGLLNDIDEIKNVIIENIQGTPILIQHVAKVSLSNRPRLGQVQRGKDDDVVEGIVLMRKGLNPSLVLEALSDKIEELDEKILPAGVEIRTFYNRQNLIDYCLHTVKKNVLEGILLVTAIVLLFMRDWRATLIVALLIPLSLLSAFIFLRLNGMFANLISIGAIDFGIIVDGAVVMVEGVFVALAHKASQVTMEKFNKLSKQGTIKKYGVEMGKAIFFSKMIIITALLPIFAFQKIEGKIFSPLAYTLAFALLGALFFTLTFVPAISSLLLNKDVREKTNPFVAFILRNYERLFDYVMQHKKRTLTAATALLVGGIIAFNLLGSEFLPHLDEGSLWVEGDAPMSISLPKSNELAGKMREDLLKFPEVRDVVSQVGRPDDGTDPKGFFSIECLVDLYPKEEWKSGISKGELIRKMQEKLNRNYLGTIWSFSQPILDNVNESVAGIDVNQAVKIFGDDLDTLAKYSKKIKDVIEDIPGMQDVGVVKNLGQPELQINLNQQKMALYGITTAEASAVIEMAIGGKAATQLFEGEKRFDIVIRYEKVFRHSEAKIGSLIIPTITGAKIQLKEIAEIGLQSGPSFIYRDNNRRFTAVQFAVRGRDLGGTVMEAQNKVENAIKLPNGYSLGWSGEYESEVRAVKRLGLVVPISLLLIFIILYVVFNSLLDVVLILLNVPFALIGGIFALLFTHTNFNISAGIGFIALFGVCIQNGVILISIFKQNLQQQMSLRDAVKNGAMNRVRPVIMTALMAIFGLLPAAISTGIGSETQKPFAIVIIGGLFSATILTLLILPIIFAWVYRKLGRSPR